MEATAPMATSTDEGGSPRANMEEGLLSLPRDSVTLSVPSSRLKMPRRSKESLAFHRDPFNRPELVHTLRGRELVLFVLLYAIGVIAIVFIFECTMPVFWINDQSRAEQRRRAAIVVRSAQKVMLDREMPSSIGPLRKT
ncbi:hypothetical protein niasHS_011654 [Heterodera schachtii]|uniref:Uncharacterized protein n=2 Tax=Heterodera TaxID=34509 RepID=A0ABD2IUB8_HETSC